MVFPINSDGLDDSIRLAHIRAEEKALSEERKRLDKYRDYYEGEQDLVFSTELFKEVFGPSFEGFRDNWCRPIVEAVQDNMTLRGFDLVENRDAANAVWDVFRANEWDEQQYLLHEGALVEGRSYVIVWPDDEIGAKIDWQPAQLMRVRYDAEDRRKPLWAYKRWDTDNGDTWVTVYTPTAIWKYVEREGSDGTAKGSSIDAFTEIPDIGMISGSLVKREVKGEDHPLLHNFGRVPVVEFNNTSFRSEIKDAIPQQDALNKTLLDMLITGEFQAYNQRMIESIADEPEGGWRAGPGEVWHIKPSFDTEGRIVPSVVHEFSTADPSTYIKIIEMWLQHMAFTSRTPARYFMQSDRGGRGDAPSGEALQIDDGPLYKKVARKSRIFGNRYVDLARMVATQIEKAKPEDFEKAEGLWKDPRHEFRLSVLEEAKVASEAGMPFKWVIRQMGLTPEEVIELEEFKDAEVDEEKEAKMEETQQTAEIAAANRPEPVQPRPAPR